MIDPKYSVKYSFPHSVVHIVDNSAYDGELPLTIADDPSLYTSIVVTGSPIGEDNKINYITRSDIINKAYGMQGLSKSQIEMYGQNVTYPAALVEQGVPVRLLRVTPEDASYAFNCILIEWKLDQNTNIFHVRFKLSTDTESSTGLPANVKLNAYKTPDKLNAALVKGWKNDNIIDEQGSVWKRRVFMTNISAGRGNIYNNFVTSIDKVSQNKRPSNVAYTFSTIDTLTDNVIESFSASLINDNNSLRSDSIENVNVLIKRREPGSSIVIPYVNEDAIREIYNDYITHLYDMAYDKAPDEVKEYLKNVYKTMNTNIFDIVYGRYLYNGDQDIYLPYYQADMPNSDIPALSEDMRRYVTVVNDPYDSNAVFPDESVLNSFIWENTTGVHKDRDNYLIGDIFLTSTGSGSTTTNMISILALINQYSGNTTVLSTETLRPLSADYTVDMDDTYTNPSLSISTIIQIQKTKLAIPSSSNSTNGCVDAIHTYLSSNVFTSATATTNKIVAVILTDDFDVNIDGKFYLFYITTNTSGRVDKIYKYDQDAIYKALDFGGASTSVANIIARPKYDSTSGKWVDSEDYAAKKYGYAIIGQTDNKSNDNNYLDALVQINAVSKPGSDTSTSTNIISRKVILPKTPKTNSSDHYENYRCLYSAPPSQVMNSSEIYGKEYDLIGYTDESENTWYIADSNASSIAIANGGSNYMVGDKLAIEGTNLYVVVKTVGNGGSITEIELNSDSTPGTRTTGEDVAARFVCETTDTGTYSRYEVPGEDANTKNVNFNNLRTLEVLYKKQGDSYIKITKEDSYDNNATYYVKRGDNVANTSVQTLEAIYNPQPAGAKFNFTQAIWTVKADKVHIPAVIKRYLISGVSGSVFRKDIENISVPNDYYCDTYGLNPSSEYGGIKISSGTCGFFEEYEKGLIDSAEFKWKYSALLTKAFKGQIDKRILSPTRCPAKFLFDFGANTVVGQTLLPYVKYSPSEIVQCSTIFTDDEKDQILLSDPNSTFIKNIKTWNSGSDDIDVKQAMYNLMEYRCYQGIPEDKKPVGPGSGLNLFLDSGITDAETSALLQKSYTKRFTNPNASWDIGGYTSSIDGITYTYTKKIVDSLFSHIKATSINKPFVGRYSAIPKNAYTSFFPDIDATDWEERESMYKIGGNSWIMDRDGNLTRTSQRTLHSGDPTSDMLQESNMRTLSQLTYLLQNKIDSYLLEYNDDSILKTMEDDCNIIFSSWVGRLVDALTIHFERDINTDGGEIVVCYCNVTFRGLVLRVPIIVNIQRRRTSEF